MIQINLSAYEALLGNISKDIISHVASCIGQCTGCMCSCRCSCSGGYVSDFEWEVV
ncbi:Cys-rich radical SAM target, FibroRumin family [[Eubacterium] yurii]|nr:Cys-rich radical SAM target, FibroRumin family [[Eubacterium] yurii]